MKILAIETSCDETAVAILECTGDPTKGDFHMDILGNALHSQIESHKEFGGVVPMMAKREHAKNLIPLFKNALTESGILKENISTLHGDKIKELENIFGREKEFLADFAKLIQSIEKPNIEAIAVTEGPGLEPALWMGIIFARALSFVWDIPLVPVNHMEGHIMSVLPQKINFPALSLLISGGHTELVLMKDWYQYEIIGQTRDDAVGEAFDKVARMLGLPYPGGPEISRLAELQRKTQTSTPEYILPRPMIHSKDFDFSFSGLKTAVLYSLKKEETPKEVVAKEFEDAVAEVLVSKTFRAIDEYNIKTLIIGGGVVSNEYIRKQFEEKVAEYSELKLLLPTPQLRTDNALMIGLAGYLRWLKKDKKDLRNTMSDIVAVVAKGNLKLT